MKLLIVVMNYYPSVGGTQIFFQHLAEHCVTKFGFKIDVFTTDSYYGPEKDRYKKIQLAEEFINGVYVKRFPYRRWHRKPFLLAQKASIKLFKRPLHYLSVRRTGPWSPALQKAIENTNADVIIGATSTYKYMLYPLLRHRLKNQKPFIYQGALHFDVNKQEQYIAKHILNAIKQSECYLANSAYEKDVLSGMGVPPQKMEVLGIATENDFTKLTFDTAYRQQLQLAPEQPLIAFVGRISQLKSIDILVKAMPLVCRQVPTVQLLIAGYDNGYVQDLKQLTATFPPAVSNNIHFKINIDTTEKNSIYNCIDLLVLPSKSESFGLVFLEAWAFKKPVIGAKIGAINSIIKDGLDGILFKPDDVEDLAEKITGLLQNSTRRAQLGIAGYNKLTNNYTWDKLGEQFKVICEKAITTFNLQKHTNA